MKKYDSTALQSSSLKFIGAVELAVADSIVDSTRRYINVLSSTSLVSELLGAVELSVCTSVCYGLITAVGTVAEVIVEALPSNHSGFVKAMKHLIGMVVLSVVVDVSYSNAAHQLSLWIDLN